jgi:hypothetical protein
MNATRSSWHLDHLLAIEIYLSVIFIGIFVGAAVAFNLEMVQRARLYDSLAELEIVRHLWIEQFALTGEPPLDSVAYARERTATRSGSPELEGASIGSIHGLEALRSRAAIEPADVGGAANARRAAHTRTGIAGGVPVAAVRHSFMAEPALVELRPALSAPDAPLVHWVCGRLRGPPGWIVPPPAEPQISDRYLPPICRYEPTR